MRKVRRGLITVVCATVLVGLTGALAPPVAGAGPLQRPLVQYRASLECQSDGSATLIFTITNTGSQTLWIQDDFQLNLWANDLGRSRLAGRLIVFPAPGFDVIAPGDTSRFVLPLDATDDGSGDGAQGLASTRLVIEAQVWFVGWDLPVTRNIPLRGCPGQDRHTA